MSKIRYLIISLGTSLLSICFFLVQPAAAQAAPNWGSSAIQKALLAGVAYCYQENGIVSEITNINTFNFSTNFVVGLSGEDDIALPSGLTLINDNGLSCKQLLFGYGGSGNNSFPGILSLSGKGPGANTDSKSAFLKGMGYTEKAKEGTENQQCVKLFYTETIEGTEKSSTVETDAICGTLDKEGYIEKLKIIPDSGTYFGYAGDFFAITDDGKIQFIIYPGVQYVHGYSIPKPQPKTSRGVGSTWSDFVTDLRQVASSSGDFSKTHYDVTRKYSYVPSADGNLVAQNEKIYTIKSSSRSAKNAMLKYLSNGNIENLDQLVLSKQEAISLLSGSIKEYFYNKVDINSYWVCDVANWADYGSFSPDYEIHIAPDGTYNKNCRLNPNLATGSPNTIYGLASTRSFDASGKTKLTLQQAVQKINEYVGKIEDETPEGEEPSTGNPIAPGENPNGEAPNCFNSAGGLGWILCPVLEGLSKIVEGIYDGVVVQSFEINSSLMDTNGNVHQVWSDFRNFANIIFAIMFIVVILSQVTGFGLDNYSIKKVLPRLIMVAVLVNLSFIICQIAVDLSNILGYQLKELFVNVGGTPTTVGSFGKALFNGLAGTAVDIALGVGVFNLASITWEFWLLPLLLFLLSCVISLLFFAILLGVRQAAIVVLIALAPVAIVCYALPNTKTLFDKWRKMLTGVLLVFPICGLMMGGGQFASRLFMGTAASGGDMGFFQILVAMLLQIVPLFFIPTVLKSSFNAMGMIGARISRFGANLNSRLAGGIRSSQGFATAQEQLRGNNARRWLARDKAGTGVMQRFGRRVRSVKGPIGQAATNMYNQKKTRMLGTASSAQLSSQKAQYASEADYEKYLDRNMDAARSRHIRELTEEYEAANVDIATDEKELQAKHEAALKALEGDQSDANIAQVQALQNMLVRSDDGRKYLYNNLATSAVNGGSKGLALASRHLMRDHAGNIKPNNRDMFSFLQDAVKADAGPGARPNFGDAIEMDEAGNINLSQYALRGLSSYDAGTLAKMDEASLDRLINYVSNNPNDINEEQKKTIEVLTRDALTNENINVQPKIRNKLSDLREKLNLGPAGRTDSGILPARGQDTSTSQSDPGIDIPRN